MEGRQETVFGWALYAVHCRCFQGLENLLQSICHQGSILSVDVGVSVILALNLLDYLNREVAHHKEQVDGALCCGFEKTTNNAYGLADVQKGQTEPENGRFEEQKNKVADYNARDKNIKTKGVETRHGGGTKVAAKRFLCAHSYGEDVSRRLVPSLPRV